MPGLVACRRRWAVGSDDLIIPAVLLLVTNGVWALVLALYSPAYAEAAKHYAGRVFWFHVIAHLSLLVACIIVEASMVTVSLRGTIMDQTPRQLMKYLLYVRLTLFLLQLGSSASALYYMWQEGLRFPATKTILGLLAWELVLVILVGWCIWDSAGDEWVLWQKQSDNMELLQLVNTAIEDAWTNRCRRMCCCVPFEGDQQSLRDVAQMFAGLFRNEDIVVTDILAALVLLQQERLQREQATVDDPRSGVVEFCSGVALTSATEMVDFRRPDIRKMLDDIKHFMYYAWGSYGWFYFIPLHCRLRGYCGFLAGLKCTSCCSDHPGDEFTIEGTDCGFCNTSAILNSFPPGHDAQLFYITHLNKIGETPFFIIVDHGKRSLVVVPRGTMSFDDAVTNVLMEPMDIPLKEQMSGARAHTGMTRAAQYMYTKITSEDLISKAQAVRRGEALYGIIVVGHSLGAGTAPLLAVLLHQDYPDLHCYALSPPGGLMSRTAVEATKHFITTVVIGDDMVPRMGLPQFRHLKLDIVSVLKRTEHSKYSVLCAGLCGRLRVTSPPNCTTDVETAAVGSEEEEQLFVAGRILHILKSTSDDGIGTKYKALWAANDSFSGLIVGANMLMHHRGDTVLNVLSKIIQSSGIDC